MNFLPFLSPRKMESWANHKQPPFPVFYFEVNIMRLLRFFSRLTGWYRLLIIASIIWIIATLIGTNPWTHIYSGLSGLSSHNNWDDFFLYGILPVAILWGFVWIKQGFKRDKAS